MKIVDTDNFGRDYPNETIIAEGITWKPFAETMCQALNNKYGGDYAPRYYKVVEDDYKLEPGFEP